MACLNDPPALFLVVQCLPLFLVVSKDALVLLVRADEGDGVDAEGDAAVQSVPVSRGEGKAALMFCLFP